MQFPNDVDGDVLRRLQNHGFDFSAPATIDFNIDFDHWPLSEAEMARIQATYPSAVAFNPDKEDIESGHTRGYVQFKVHAHVTYDLVMRTQEQATAIAKDMGGVCESWGVWNG